MKKERKKEKEKKKKGKKDKRRMRERKRKESKEKKRKEKSEKGRDESEGGVEKGRISIFLHIVALFSNIYFQICIMYIIWKEICRINMYRNMYYIYVEKNWKTK